MSLRTAISEPHKPFVRSVGWLASLLALALVPPAGAQPAGTAFTFQGRLTDGGTPSDGPFDFRFIVYTAPVGGSQVGPTVLSDDLLVVSGLFTVSLDFGAAAFVGDARFLEIAVRPGASTGAYSVFGSRQELKPAPQSVFSQTAPWAGVTGKPAGFADNVDNDLLGTTTCAAGQLMKWNGASWACAPDVDTFTTYSATNGLTLSANTIQPVYGGNGTALLLAHSDHNHFGQSWTSSGPSGLAITNSSGMAFVGQSSVNTPGIFGSALSTSGFNANGVWGETSSSAAVVSLTVHFDRRDHVWRPRGPQPTSGAGVQGESNASSGAGYGVVGFSGSTSGRGVFGWVTATTGLAVGVWGESRSSNGQGVRGTAIATTGPTVGVSGVASSTQGQGVLGQATSIFGQTYGVFGQTASSAGTGVFGVATSTAGAALGMWAQANGIDGSGVYGSASGSGSSVGVRGRSFGTASAASGVIGELTNTTGTGAAVLGIQGVSATAYAAVFSGRVAVTGTLSKGGGSFKIDHPLDPENRYLYHSFVESPDMMNVYNGNVVTDADGLAVVTLPEWFEALNRDFRYQLTIVDDADAPGFVQVKVARKIAANRFTIRASAPGVEVSWQVTGIRKDPFAEKYRIPVEEDKPEGERGTYLHPDAWGVPLERGYDQRRGALRPKPPEPPRTDESSGS
jgi:hypothetical protein